MSMAGEFYSLEPPRGKPFRCDKQDCEKYCWHQDSWGSGSSGCTQFLCEYKKISYEKILEIQKDITYNFKRDMRSGDLCGQDIRIQRKLISDIGKIINGKFDKEIEERKIKDIKRINEEIEVLKNKIKDIQDE